MNFIEERETPGNVVKKRCGEIGMLFRILFWISLLFLAAKVIWAIYIGTMPGSSFRLTLMDAEGLTYGVAFHGAGQRIEFQEGVLSYAAQSSPKLCFMAGMAVYVLLGAVTTWILWLGRAQVSLVDGKMVLVGCLIISLFYIFEYGSALQKEADETL